MTQNKHKTVLFTIYKYQVQLSSIIIFQTLWSAETQSKIKKMDASFLDRELKSAEKSLAKLEEKQQLEQQRINNSSDVIDGSEEDDNPHDNSVYARLIQLQNKTDSLALAQDYLLFLESASVTLDNNNNNNNNNNNSDDNVLISAQAKLCDDLAKIVILKHADTMLDTCPYMYEDAYLPLFQYVHEYLVGMLRQELQSSRYPTAKGCRELLDTSSGARLTNICELLTRLEVTHEKILQAVVGIDDAETSSSGINTSNSTVLLEVFHPILDRIYFHFVNTGVDNDDDGDINNGKITATRIDRLPEWLFNYINKNILQDGGPYEVISKMIGPHLAMPFCQELIRLIQWVIVEQRNFFEDPAIAGFQSNPQVLYQAVEQFLIFDTTLIELLADTNTNAAIVVDVDSGVQSETDTSSFRGLMDVLIVPNDCLFDWWLQRERESVFSTLFPDDDGDDDDDDGGDHENILKAPLARNISPRAELFCALIRSVQLKASTLTSPSKYLREVAVPLCSQFVDSLHHTSVDLRNRLIQKCNSEHDIVTNINKWIDIINGTKLAAEVLLTKERTWHHEKETASSVSSQSDHDLARFGRSLERLVEVMMEEFATTFVETTLMEHAKFANYLMLSSHLLADPEWDVECVMGEGDLMGVTVELRDTNINLQYFQQTCDSIIRRRKLTNDVPDRLILEADEQENLASFAPLGMRSRVVNQIVDKLLEVALNGVTPDIWLKGATVFARDVYGLIGSDCDIPAVNRLLEVTRVMTMDYEKFSHLSNALCNLMGSDGFIDIEVLTTDTTLREEATSMLKAKNINYPLDAISILNRRRS
jgi:hypothetical protein